MDMSSSEDNAPSASENDEELKAVINKSEDLEKNKTRDEKLEEMKDRITALEKKMDKMMNTMLRFMESRKFTFKSHLVLLPLDNLRINESLIRYPKLCLSLESINNLMSFI
ncbi:unnamed protein product [Ambrosiozyma monospora]|uniref:Unnamed protein product n=1 Tax=Ambrosiozyma monospora TaxID=43982 RepID=A0ACB5SS44_AMBMO|nr:unnamed protein product [Ambrosiozyma monospora]